MGVSSKSFDPVYVSKDKTIVVIEEVALHTVNPSVLALAQNVATECCKKKVAVQDVKCQEPVYCVK